MVSTGDFESPSQGSSPCGASNNVSARGGYNNPTIVY